MEGGGEICLEIPFFKKRSPCTCFLICPCFIFLPTPLKSQLFLKLLGCGWVAGYFSDVMGTCQKRILHSHVFSSLRYTENLKNQFCKTNKIKLHCIEHGRGGPTTLADLKTLHLSALIFVTHTLSFLKM